MASITINKVSFLTAIKKKQLVTVRYRLTSDPDVAGSYTLAQASVIVEITGVFLTPVIITGLLVCQTYTVLVENECSGNIIKKNFNTACDDPEAPVFKYGFTDLDTTGNEPLEAEYITSVDAVFAALAEGEGSLTPGGPTVQVQTFNNLSDKVLFIQVPAAEAAFTKWSEVGNGLQQNIPIDPNYATGTGVWFKSTRGGETIYITRAQTTFTGAVILSR